jgi:beta-lactamase class A
MTAKPEADSPPLAEISGLFTEARCDGAIHVLDLDSDAQIGLSEDAVFPSASVFKVQVALAFFQLVAAGRLDDATSLTVTHQLHTLGPTGISLFRDPVTVSLHDLAVQMVTASDNSATDILISLVGFNPIKAVAEELGLTQTAVDTDNQGLLQTLAEAIGRENWQELVSAWYELEPARVLAALAEPGPIRTSPRDCTKLLAALWSNAAEPTAATIEVRQLMALQSSRNRIASAFGPRIRVAAKSGSLLGVVRNEIGVVEYENHSRYAAAVFTRGWEPYAQEHEIDAAIGLTVRMAIEWLQATST